MATKKEISYSVLGLAHTMWLEGERSEAMDEWILRLLWIVDDLNKDLRTHPWYKKILFEEERPRKSRMKAKLRALVDHPATPEPERDVARRMLANLS